jgi:hypothetical protein
LAITRSVNECFIVWFRHLPRDVLSKGCENTGFD